MASDDIRDYVTEEDLDTNAFVCLSSASGDLVSTKPSVALTLENTCDLVTRDLRGHEINTISLSSAILDCSVDPISTNAISATNAGLLVDPCKLFDQLASLPLACPSLSSV